MDVMQFFSIDEPRAAESAVRKCGAREFRRGARAKISGSESLQRAAELPRRGRVAVFGRRLTVRGYFFQMAIDVPL